MLYQIHRDILAVAVSQGVVEYIPKGELLEVHDAIDIEPDHLVRVQWKENAYKLFAVDLAARASEVKRSLAGE